MQWIHTFHNSISRCVLNNSFSTEPFVQQGVRQGDSLSSYLFTMIPEILPIKIQSNKNVERMLVHGKEIKLHFFADNDNF